MKCNMKGDMTYMNEDPKEHPKSVIQWNMDNLVSVFKEVYAGSGWIDLIKFLDVDLDAIEDFYFQSQEAFDIFMEIWTRLKPQNKTFPVEILISSPWKNKKAHVITLEYAINYSYTKPDILFEKAKRRQDTLSTLQNIKPTATSYLRIWKCIDLVQTLVALSDSPHYHQVRTLFETPLKQIPEYLLLTLLKTKPKTGRNMLSDLYSSLLPMFLSSHVNSIPILTEVYTTNSNLLINSMADLYRRNPKSMNLSRILDISQSLKNSLIDIITLSKDYSFTLQLGMLAAKRDFLNFEKWIEKVLRAEGDGFVRCLLKYLKTSISGVSPGEDGKGVEKALERSMLSEEKLSIIFDNLTKLAEEGVLEYETRQRIKELYSKVVKLYPSINSESSNNEEIEEKANEYFQQLYKGEKEVEDLIRIMKEFRSSQNTTEREIYACMVQNLFDEWKFFPKYPKKELWMTARLFGKIISEKKIIDGVVTDIGLKCIVEGLKREGKMFDFAITALEECKDSIDNETGLKNILTCKQLQTKKPDLYDYIKNRCNELHGTEEQPPPRKVEPQVSQPQPQPQPPVQAFPNQPISRAEQMMNRDMERNPMMSNTPDPALAQRAMPPDMGRMRKMTQPMNPLTNTPTPTGKYFTNQSQNLMQSNEPFSHSMHQMPEWKHTPQMIGGRMMYPQDPNQNRSARQFDNFSLGPSAMEGVGASRALNLQSKNFKPKTQQIQEYLKNEEMMNLPPDFIDFLVMTLNGTGLENMHEKIKIFEQETKEEYYPQIAHYVVIKRVIESDEKRIEFFAKFFHQMKDRTLVQCLIKECIEVILKIIVSEAINLNKNDTSRAATTPVKNVAHFLGCLTLMHNQILFANDLDLKQLLIEAHSKKDNPRISQYGDEKRCISIAILIVCKILRTGEESRIFTPYNPWMDGLYAMLMEYLNYYLRANQDFDRNLDKEIQLVLRNRRVSMDHPRESTLFRDFDGRRNNLELKYILEKINSNPLIVIPKINEIQRPSSTSEEEKKETSARYEQAFNQDIVIINEWSKNFPNISPEFLRMIANQGINEAMREIIDMVIRRVIPIASITTRVLVLKDFALEPDPEKLKQASISTAKSLAGMLAQITCKDILRYQFIKSLKDLILNSNDPNFACLDEDQKKTLIEMITKENSEIGCNKIIAAVQKEALNNISKDDSIQKEIMNRKRYHETGQDFRNEESMASFYMHTGSNVRHFDLLTMLPELLRPQEDGLTEAEFQVYKDFDDIPNAEFEEAVDNLLSDDVPVNAPANSAQRPGRVEGEPPHLIKFEQIWKAYIEITQQYGELNNAFRTDVSEFKAMMGKIEGSQKMFLEKFLNFKKSMALDANLLVYLIENKIISLQSWQSQFVGYLRESSAECINDVHIIDFVELFVIRGVLDRGCIKDTQIADLLGCAEGFSNAKNTPNSLRWKAITKLLELTNVSSEVYDELAEIYFEQWVSYKNVLQMKNKFWYKLGVVFKNSQHMSMFVESSLRNALRSLDSKAEKKDHTYFLRLDKFISMIILCSLDWFSQSGLKTQNVIDETQVLKIIWEMIDECHSSNQWKNVCHSNKENNETVEEFDQTPFRRILSAFLNHFNDTFKNLEITDFERIKKKNEILIVFADLFKQLSPSKYPAFSFAWADLISSRFFMPAMLSGEIEYNTQERWFKMQELFNWLFTFLKENIYEHSTTSPSLEKFFEGVLKICLVVLHDFPEFLWYYYFQFINNLPLYRTGNLRNMILAAYPKNLRLPDPTNEITKIENISGLVAQDAQALLEHYVDEGNYYTLKADLDNYLETNDNEKLEAVCEYLENCQVIKNHRRIINTGVIHATMLYLARDIEDKESVQELEDPALVTKFQLMCENLSTPVRDILLNAMFNELRFLNKSTVFFINCLLHIFRNSDSEDNIISSQIARIWVSRLRLPKIHPWGLHVFKNRISKEEKFKSMNIAN